MGENVLKTARLFLEPTREEHAPILWNAIERSLPELRRRMVWASKSSPELQKEGTKRGAFVLDGVQVDTHSYGLLATDPRSGI